MRVVVRTPRWSFLEYSLALLVGAFVLPMAVAGLRGFLAVERVCCNFASADGAGACVEATSLSARLPRRLSCVAEVLAA